MPQCVLDPITEVFLKTQLQEVCLPFVLSEARSNKNCITIFTILSFLLNFLCFIGNNTMKNDVLDTINYKLMQAQYFKIFTPLKYTTEK